MDELKRALAEKVDRIEELLALNEEHCLTNAENQNCILDLETKMEERAVLLAKAMLHELVQGISANLERFECFSRTIARVHRLDDQLKEDGLQ